MAANEPGQPALSVRGASGASHDDGPESCNIAVPASALAIGAHPDDVEFGCGATLAKWAAAGCLVHHVICTDGSKGSWDPEREPTELARARQIEQRAAAQALGARGSVAFLGWSDGELESGLRQRWQVAYWIRRLRPEVVLGHDPWKRYRLHPDHRHAGLLACEGIVAARDPHFFPEQDLASHRPSALLLWEADAPDHAEDVTGFVDVKLAALEAHESQFESTMHAIDDAALEAFRARIRSRLTEHGAWSGSGAAEVFKLIADL